MTDAHAIHHDGKNGVSATLLTLLGIMIGLDAKNRNATHFIFTQVVNNKGSLPAGGPSDLGNMVVILMIVGHRHHIGAQAGKRKTNVVAVRIGDHRTNLALEFKAGMTAVRNCHMLDDTILDKSFIINGVVSWCSIVYGGVFARVHT